MKTGPVLERCYVVCHGKRPANYIFSGHGRSWMIPPDRNNARGTERWRNADAIARNGDDWWMAGREAARRSRRIVTGTAYRLEAYGGGGRFSGRSAKPGSPAPVLRQGQCGWFR